MTDGTVAYEFMLTDCLWGVYQMIGKLNPRIYVLSAPDAVRLGRAATA
jgi:hypothetical protein